MELSYQAAPEDAGKPLSLFLREQGISAGFIKSVKYGAGFFVNGVPVHTNHRLQPGQTVRFALPPHHRAHPPDPRAFFLSGAPAGGG